MIMMITMMMTMMMMMMMMMPTMFGSRVTHPVTEGAKSGGEGEDKTRRGASLKINQIRFLSFLSDGSHHLDCSLSSMPLSSGVPKCPKVSQCVSRSRGSKFEICGWSQLPKPSRPLKSHGSFSPSGDIYVSSFSIYNNIGREARIAPNQSRYCSCG